MPNAQITDNKSGGFSFQAVVARELFVLPGVSELDPILNALRISSGVIQKFDGTNWVDISGANGGNSVDFDTNF